MAFVCGWVSLVPLKCLLVSSKLTLQADVSGLGALSLVSSRWHLAVALVWGLALIIVGCRV